MHSTRLPTFVYQGDSEMKKVHFGYKAVCLVVLSLTFAALAQAAPAFPMVSRTWVSGVGTDANPCSRTAPCKTFAGAYALTLAGGEIDALDPGDFGTPSNGAPGPLTIAKSITIDGTQGGGFASVMLDSSGTGPAITISAATTDVVTIRNISINGMKGTGDNGIVITTGGTVHIENCVVSGTAGSGIADVRTGSSNSIFYLYIKDTISKSCGTRGIRITPQSSGVFVIAFLDNVRAEDNGSNGVDLTAGVYASLDHCTLSGNRLDGLVVTGNSGGVEGTASAASAHVDYTNSAGNGSATGAGFHAGTGGVIRLSASTSYNNTTGLQIDSGGRILSYGHNRIAANTNGNGPPSGTISEQ
jgi:hypothetical protein